MKATLVIKPCKKPYEIHNGMKVLYKNTVQEIRHVEHLPEACEADETRLFFKGFNPEDHVDMYECQQIFAKDACSEVCEPLNDDQYDLVMDYISSAGDQYMKRIVVGEVNALGFQINIDDEANLFIKLHKTFSSIQLSALDRRANEIVKEIKSTGLMAPEIYYIGALLVNQMATKAVEMVSFSERLTKTVADVDTFLASLKTK